jgi:hypothetical protein
MSSNNNGIIGQPGRLPDDVRLPWFPDLRIGEERRCKFPPMI